MTVPTDNHLFATYFGHHQRNTNISVQPRADLRPAQRTSKRTNIINGNCFASPTPGHNGAYVMPYIKGPAFFTNDLSLFKNFS